MPAGDVYQCTVEQNFDNQDMVSVLHFVQIGGDGTGDPREKVGLIWLAAFETAYLLCATVDLQVDVLRIRRVLPTQTQSRITTVGTSGTAPGDPIATNNVGVLRQYATKDGRKGVGNQRMPAVPRLSVNGGQIDVAYAAVCELYGDAMEIDQTDVASGYTFRSCVLGTDNVPRQVQLTRMTSRIKNLRSRTIGQGI